LKKIVSTLKEVRRHQGLSVRGLELLSDQLRTTTRRRDASAEQE